MKKFNSGVIRDALDITLFLLWWVQNTKVLRFGKNSITSCYNFGTVLTFPSATLWLNK